MTQAVQELLDTFDALTDAEKQEAAAQLLRRILDRESCDLPEDALVAAAEELFIEMDARECVYSEERGR